MIAMIGCSAPTLHGTKTEINYSKVWFTSNTNDSLMLCEEKEEIIYCYICPGCSQYLNHPVVVAKKKH